MIQSTEIGIEITPFCKAERSRNQGWDRRDQIRSLGAGSWSLRRKEIASQLKITFKPLNVTHK